MKRYASGRTKLCPGYIPTAKYMGRSRRPIEAAPGLTRTDYRHVAGRSIAHGGRKLDVAAATRLAQTLSDERMGTYLNAPGIDGDPVRAIRLYAWNTEVSAALWGPLQALEVACRNAMHRELAGRFGRTDWWHASTLELHRIGQESVADAEATLRRRGRPPSDGAVVAELSWAFWVALLAPRYEATLWTPALRHAFPSYSGRRGDLHKPLDYLRTLRNRVAHHEPIFSRDLRADLFGIHKQLRYVCADTAEWVQSCQRATVVIERRQETVAGTRRMWF
jgi:hypothetical protein